jgi:hypothetical protein
MAQREQVFQGQPPIFGGARLLPSPSQFFLTGEDRLRVVSANSLAGVALKIQWRTALFTGAVVPTSETHTPNSDRTTKTQDFELGTGSLLNVTVFAGAGSPVSGQTFVMVQIVRGVGAAAIVLGTLLAGYVTSVQALGFPGSPIVASTTGEPVPRAIVGTTPAAGSFVTETCPTGARWEIVTVFAQFTTSGVAGSRQPWFQVNYGANPAGVTTWDVVVPAANTVDLTYGQNLNPGENFANTIITMPIPLGQRLRAGDQFFLGAVGLLAGDQFTAPVYQVREWLEVA